MAQRVEVEVEISATGEVQVQVRGVAGHGCLELAKALEEAVGETLEQRRTSEYYQPEPVYEKKRTT